MFDDIYAVAFNSKAIIHHYAFTILQLAYFLKLG